MNDPVIPQRFVTLRGLRTGCLDGLHRFCAATGIARYAATDVSCGSWRSYQVASELCEQLGVASPWRHRRDVRRPAASTSTIRYGQVIGAGIDAEARGEHRWIAAVDAVARIAGAAAGCADMACFVLCPRRHAAWEDEDVAFVEAAATRMQRAGIPLVLVATDPLGPLPVSWRVEWTEAGGEAVAVPAQPYPVQLVPGVVHRDMLAGLAPDLSPREVPLAPLPRGRYLVPPEWRRPNTASRFEFDRLGATSGDHPWLRAYAQCEGNNFHVDPDFLAQQAWERFREGGGGIGLRLLQRASVCARDRNQRATLQAQAQGMRIALGRYGDVAAQADPPAGVPDQLRSFLCIAKGWGLAMQGVPEAERALTYLDEALDSSASDEREHLFLLNIRALAQTKVGEVDGALAVEEDIRRRSRVLPQRDWTLEYVNSLNIARLYRRKGDLAKAEKHYGDAFATAAGARSGTEAAHANFWAGAMASERGEAARAFRAWMRTALHWVASDSPEGLGARVSTAILGRPPLGGEDLVESVSARLVDLLCSAAEKVDQPIDDSCPMAPPGASLANLEHRGHRTVLGWGAGARGWSVLTTAEPMGFPFEAPSHQRLRRILCGLVLRTCPEVEPADIGTFVVDDGLGCEMPTTMGELIAAALRLGISRLCFDGCELYLDPDVQDELTSAQRVEVGPAVCRLVLDDDAVVVHFKRHLPSRTLHGDEARILASLQDGTTVAALGLRLGGGDETSRLLASLRRLEEWRIVTVHMPEHAHVQRLVSGRFRA